MSENCKPRGFSWLVKSCLPNPQQESRRETTSIIIRTSSSLNRSELHLHTGFSSLPDDLLLECLSRVSQSSLSSISLVCRRWSQIMDSSAFFDLRRNQGYLRQTIFAIGITDYGIFTANHCIKDDETAWKTAPFRSKDDETAWKTAPFRSMKTVTDTPEIFDGSFSHARLTPIGRSIYILSRDGTLLYDTWTNTITSRSPMLFQRKKFAAATISGKIYITGGAPGTEAVEEYEPETDTWRVVSEAPRRRYGCIGAAVDGVFYVIGGLKIGGRIESTRGGCSEAHLYASSMDLYDVETRLWMRSRGVPGGGCVVAACAAGGYVYVLASHAVELSFWRYDARRRKQIGGGGTGTGTFGEWCRLKSPPLPAQVRLDSTVRFSCVGVGEEVVLVQVCGCIDDLLRRSGRSSRGLKEGLVLVFESESGEWRRGADLPEIMRRAACVCVEC